MANTFPNPDGRPSNYRKEYCDLLIEHMKQGKSFETFGAVLFEHTDGKVRAPKSVLYDWVKKHPEFAEAKEMAECFCQDFYEEMGITAINSPPNQFNTGVWVFNMKNRFGWRDKVETTQANTEDPPGFNVTPDA